MAKKEVDLSKLMKEMDKSLSKIKKDPQLEKKIKESEKLGKQLAKDHAKVDDK